MDHSTQQAIEAARILDDMAKEVGVFRLMVPTIGDTFELLEDWTFKLYREGRNGDFAQKSPGVNWQEYASIDLPRYGQHAIAGMNITLPAGTLLKLDRIYIRKGMSEYDSLTFWCNTKDKKPQFKGRFCARLSDCNNMLLRKV